MAQQVIAWIDQAIDISKRTSYRKLHQAIIEEQQYLDNPLQRDCRSVDAFVMLGHKADEVIDQLEILHKTIFWKGFDHRGLHVFKDKLSKIVKEHAKVLYTLNGLKQYQMKGTVDKIIEETPRN